MSVLHEFCLDLALRYFVLWSYSLNGFMGPLRTGLSEGAFCVLGDCRRERSRSLGCARDDGFSRDDNLSRGKAGFSTSRQLRFANLMLRSR